MQKFWQIIITITTAITVLLSAGNVSYANRYGGITKIFNDASSATKGTDSGAGTWSHGAPTPGLSPPGFSTPGNSPSFNPHGSGTQGITEQFNKQNK